MGNDWRDPQPRQNKTQKYHAGKPTHRKEGAAGCGIEVIAAIALLGWGAVEAARAIV